MASGILPQPGTSVAAGLGGEASGSLQQDWTAEAMARGQGALWHPLERSWALPDAGLLDPSLWAGK